MKRVKGLVMEGVVLVASAAPAAPAAPAAVPAPDPTARHLAGNGLEFTRAQIANGFGPSD